MTEEQYNNLERFSIKTIDGGISDTEAIKQMKLINKKLVELNNLLDGVLKPVKPLTNAEILEEVAKRG